MRGILYHTLLHPTDKIKSGAWLFPRCGELPREPEEGLGRALLALLKVIAGDHNIDGIFTGNPADPQSQLIKEVLPGTDLSQYIQKEKSSAGRGGMQSKYATASKVQAAGIQVIIANGKRENILVDLMEQPSTTPHTIFKTC